MPSVVSVLRNKRSWNYAAVIRKSNWD